jgi:DNA-directed RNA polymerase subunit RPC12/RpoP
MIVVCAECGREFDLADEQDAEEWYYGHDCEEGTACGSVLSAGMT